MEDSDIVHACLDRKRKLGRCALGNSGKLLSQFLSYPHTFGIGESPCMEILFGIIIIKILTISCVFFQ